MSRGFSLIELLIVVAILGILSAIAVPNFMGSRVAANEARAIAYVRSWVAGQELYKRANGNYSSTDEDLVIDGFVNKAINSFGDADDNAYTYSIDSPSNPTQWFGRARRRSPTVGKRSFYVDQSGVIRWRVGNTADAIDPPLN